MTALRSRFCALVGCRIPIVQTGMGWVATPPLVAAVSQAGAFGILAGATLSLEELAASIAAVKAATDQPFGVNLRADAPDAQARVQLLIDQGVCLASFAAAPKKELIDRLKGEGVLVMPTVGKRRHAEKVEQWGVDAIIAQGHEGGGHTGPVPTSLLLPDVVDAVSIPVLAAGGFRCGRGLVAAMSYGADGIAMGTRFLLTEESPVPDSIKAQYLAASVTDTSVSTRIDGHPQRVINTPFVVDLEKRGPLGRLGLAIKSGLAFKRITGVGLLGLIRSGLAMRKRQGLTLAQAIAAANAPMLTRQTMVEGQIDAGILPTGQVTGLIAELPSSEALITTIMDEAESVLNRLSGVRDV
jgi:NAD(P)H-dependent flavin oxidoreductase YrpB (nitropropane dioxygenase family)